MGEESVSTFSDCNGRPEKGFTSTLVGFIGSRQPCGRLSESKLKQCRQFPVFPRQRDRGLEKFSPSPIERAHLAVLSPSPWFEANDSKRPEAAGQAFRAIISAVDPCGRSPDRSCEDLNCHYPSSAIGHSRSLRCPLVPRTSTTRIRAVNHRRETQSQTSPLRLSASPLGWIGYSIIRWHLTASTFVRQGTFMMAGLKSCITGVPQRKRNTTQTLLILDCSACNFLEMLDSIPANSFVTVQGEVSLMDECWIPANGGQVVACVPFSKPIFLVLDAVPELPGLPAMTSNASGQPVTDAANQVGGRVGINIGAKTIITYRQRPVDSQIVCRVDDQLQRISNNVCIYSFLKYEIPARQRPA